jgi:hypothetical protein
MGPAPSMGEKGRVKRYLVGLLAAYAATMTLLAVHWSAEARLYRRCFDMLIQGKHGRPVHYPSLVAIYADFGLDLGPWMYWYLRLADSGRLLIAVVGALFACGLILPKYLVRRRGPRHPVA